MVRLRTYPPEDKRERLGPIVSNYYYICLVYMQSLVDQAPDGHGITYLMEPLG